MPKARFEEHIAGQKTCKCWRSDRKTHAHIIGWKAARPGSIYSHFEEKSNPVFSKEDALNNLLGGMEMGYVTLPDARRITEEILASKVLPLEVEGEQDLGYAMGIAMMGLLR